jgi:hypothetical protein
VTEEQQNIALAELLSQRTGIPYVIEEWPFGWRLLCGTKKNVKQCFTKSLDAMALIEAAMTDGELRAYTQAVYELTGAGRHSTHPQKWRDSLLATAAQRALAACRALGLDKEQS